MDQGLAAVVAGAAGLVGAVLGAWLGGRAATEGTRLGASIAAAESHALWVRQERTKAYDQVCTAYSAIGVRLYPVYAAVCRGELPTAEQEEAALRAVGELAGSCSGTVSFLGTPVIASAAQGVVDQCDRFEMELRPFLAALRAGTLPVTEESFGDRLNAHIDALRGARNTLTDEFRGVLLHDGAAAGPEGG
ncbi:hypothetical protein [Streptomyces sp. NPDC029674]|uniref:hypothetical protein n=1 Tax=Streptomyces sp. NPDC029674 TaxID=3365297 RepID=UPI00384B8919